MTFWSFKQGKSLVLCIAVLMFLFIELTYASPLKLPESAISSKRLQQRLLYQQMLVTLQNRKTLPSDAEYERFKSGLRDYPLLPYVEFMQLNQHINQANGAIENAVAVKRFAQDHPKHPLSNQLLSQWRTRLAAEGQWKKLLQEMPRPSDDEGKCIYYYAQYQTGNSERAWQGAQMLWLVGEPQPSQCDRLFDAWKKSSQFRSELYWQRAKLALQNGQISFAQQLSNYLTPVQQRMVALWANVHQNPQQLSRVTDTLTKIRALSYLNPNQINIDSANPTDASQIVLYGLHSWIKKDVDQAISLYQAYQAQLSFDVVQERKFLDYVARYLSYHYDPRSLHWLNKADPLLQSDTLIIRRIRLALNSHDWQAVYDWTQSLSDDERSSPQWRYWNLHSQQQLIENKARPTSLSRLPGAPSVSRDFNSAALSSSTSLPNQYCLLVACSPLQGTQAPTLYETASANQYPLTRNNRSTNSARLVQGFASLAAERGYYGFLASEKLRQPLNFQQEPSRVTQAELNHLVNSPVFQQLQELQALNQTAEANRLWRTSIQNFSPQQRSVAAHYASLNGEHFKAISAAAESSEKNNLSLRFPRAFAASITHAAQSAQLDSDWVFALIRQESAFRADASSPVGAIGLMQLMPATARHVAQKSKISLPNLSSLKMPEQNVRLGTLYLSEIYQSLNNNVFAATAAYNAGPSRAQEWLKTQSGLSAAEWIETIPIPETQDYVKNIMTYRAIYRFQNQAQVTRFLE